MGPFSQSYFCVFVGELSKYHQKPMFLSWLITHFPLLILKEKVGYTSIYLQTFYETWLAWSSEQIPVSFASQVIKYTNNSRLIKTLQKKKKKKLIFVWQKNDAVGNTRQLLTNRHKLGSKFLNLVMNYWRSTKCPCVRNDWLPLALWVAWLTWST